jgi:serine/threonine protein kinase
MYARFCSSCGLPNTANNETEIIAARDTAEAPSDPFIARVLDSKYELLARLGTGGAGTVYRARRLHIGDEVAIKVLNKDYILEETAVERFRREARSAAMIHHPNVVTIHDFSESKSDTPAYIVMELVAGTPLRELLKHEGHLSPERAVALMRDVCAGVGLAHRQGLLHRDLKPDNVIVQDSEVDGERGVAKVVDFGIAKLRGSTSEFNLTQTGTLVGTPFYMSPEQWHGEQLDPRSDVYSLGAMFYEMLAGTPPFNATSLPELIAKQLNDEPPPFAPSLNVPPALERVCRSALAKKRDERPRDATVLGRELQSALVSPAAGIESRGPSFEVPSLKEPGIASRPAELPTLALVQPGQRSNRIKSVLGSIFALLIFAVITAAAIFLVRSFVVNNGANANSNGSQNVPGENTASEKGAENSNSGNTSPLTSQVDLIGKWTGTYGPANSPATLMVKEYTDGKFSGVLEQGEVRVAFNGSVDTKSRRVTIKETQVLSGSGWSLGEDTGEISPDGRKMSGSGKDAAGGQFGISYQWSFER